MIWSAKSVGRAFCAGQWLGRSGPSGPVTWSLFPLMPAWRRRQVAASGCRLLVTGSGQHPGAVLAGQAPADEVAQVEGCGPALEPGVVPGHAQVAELEAPAAAAGDLGDDPLDVRPVLLVVLAEAQAGGPVTPGGAQQRVVLVQDQGTAVLVCGAAGSRGRRR